MSAIGLIFGGRSVEHRVSVSSARTVDRALQQAGHKVVPLALDRRGAWVDPAVGESLLRGSSEDVPDAGESPRASLRHLLPTPVEALFPVTHGTWGEDGCLQGLCEMLDLPYVGTDVRSSALAMDKLLVKPVLEAAGIATVDYEGVDRRDYEADAAATLERLRRLPLPVFVKPSVGGSSVGVSKVAEVEGLAPALEEAFRFDDRLVVERGVQGRELECGVLGYRNLQASVIGEIRPGKDFYDYADKYLEDGAELIAPAPLDESVSDRLRQVAVEAFAAIGGTGMARVDFLLESNGDLWVNEINTLPGFTSISMYPRLWELTGVPLPELVDRLVRIALERHTDRQRLDDGIKTWIAELTARAAG